MSLADVLVITALELERNAIRDAAAWRDISRTGVRRWESKDANNFPDYLFGAYSLPDGQSLTIALAHPTRMGSNFVAGIASTLMERLKPKALAMCGVCAGNPSDVALGDVIIANTVFQYDEGKRTITGFEGDLFPTPMDVRWVRRATELTPEGLPSYGAPSEFDAKLWLLGQFSAGADPAKHPAYVRYFPSGTGSDKIRQLHREGLLRRDHRKLVTTESGEDFLNQNHAFAFDPPSRLPFAIRVGSMASGNAVVKDGLTWNMLKERGQRSALALEMEAATIGITSYTHSLSHWIVVKGVMDHADPNKDDRYKPFAARASAEVLLRFLEGSAESLLEPTREKEATAARPLSLPTEYNQRQLIVLVVGREGGSDALATVTERALMLGRTANNLEALSGKSIAASPNSLNENVFRLDVGDAFVDRPTMIDCLRAVCLSDIVIFDVTDGDRGIEPGIMLFLGVRAVNRRGVSICSVDRDPEQMLEIGLPYNLQHLNLASHANGNKVLDAPERLAIKIANGLHDIVHDLTYLDLPAFDPIRNLGGEIGDYTPIPFYRGPLYLGPFNDTFQRSCFRQLEPEITVLLDAVARQKDGRDYRRPRVALLLDYDRARMVSQSLYHSIRRHDFCLIDWTWLRPNVFFEMGVRLASRESGDVHIVADLKAVTAIVNTPGMQWPEPSPSAPAKDATTLRQIQGMKRIFSPIEYSPDSAWKLRKAASAILDRWRASRESRHDNAILFREIARAATPPPMGAIESVASFFRKRSAQTYLHDQDTLLSTLLYEDHNPSLQLAAVIQSITLRLAALFVSVSTGCLPQDGLTSEDEVEELAQQIRRLSRRVGAEQDGMMLAACLDRVRSLLVIR